MTVKTREWGQLLRIKEKKSKIARISGYQRAFLSPVHEVISS